MRRARWSDGVVLAIFAGLFVGLMVLFIAVDQGCYQECWRRKGGMYTLTVDLECWCVVEIGQPAIELPVWSTESRTPVKP